jgi:voltage-gated potassium channel
MLTEMDEHAETRGRAVVLVTDEFPAGLPSAVATLDVKLVTGPAQAPETLERAGVAAAAVVILIANDPNDRVSDGISYDILTRVREQNRSARVLVECVDDRNRRRLTDVGATVVVRPIRAYPEMTVTAIADIGSSTILENLVSASGERIVLLAGSFTGSWKRLVGDALERGTGLPIAARLRTGEIVTAPPAERELEADALFVIVGPKA